MELFVFTDSLVFRSVFYKGGSKSPLLLEISLRLHQAQMRGYLILHVVHIEITVIVESGFDGLFRGGYFGRMTRDLNPLQFVLLDQVSLDVLTGVDPWLRLWWVKSLTRIITSYWFEQKLYNLLWAPPSVAAEMAL